MREASAIIPTLPARLSSVQDAIASAARATGRDPAGIRLVAVSKTVPAEAIRAAYALGQRDFGENYVQEALAKMDALQDLPDIVWHFIGPLQSNKTRAVAERFDWVHSVDRLKTAERLSSQRPPSRAPLSTCLQVNLSAEATKSGALPDEVAPLLRQLAALPGLRLRGLMAIPEPTDDSVLQRARFASLRQLLEASRADVPTLDTLSMGMTDDLAAAIAEGATHVRVGRALFGERT